MKPFTYVPCPLAAFSAAAFLQAKKQTFINESIHNIDISKTHVTSWAFSNSSFITYMTATHEKLNPKIRIQRWLSSTGCLIFFFTNGAINKCNIQDMVTTTFIYMFVKFQSNISKAAKVMTARGMIGQKGLGWYPCVQICRLIVKVPFDSSVFSSL